MPFSIKHVGPKKINKTKFVTDWQSFIQSNMWGPLSMLESSYIWHYFYKRKITALIHKNVIEMFLRCTVYELWFNLVCRFCMDPTLCYVVWVSNQKLNEQSVCSRFAWRYSFSQLSIRTLEYLGLDWSSKYSL